MINELITLSLHELFINTLYSQTINLFIIISCRLFHQFSLTAVGELYKLTPHYASHKILILYLLKQHERDSANDMY
jgi:hypothetical protein